MAFTPWEFWRGVLWTWAWFGMLFVAASVVEGVLSWGANVTYYAADMAGAFVPSVVMGSIFFLFYGPLYATPALLGATAAFFPVAYLLGLLLRGETRRSVHLLVFAILGTVVSATTTAAIVLWWRVDIGVVFLLPCSVAAAVAVPLGWRSTATRALLGDAWVAEHAEDAGVS